MKRTNRPSRNVGNHWGESGFLATVAVYERRGQRLGTVYLSSTPESGQATLSDQLTALITECLTKWCNDQGRRLPRLCYVSDTGEYEWRYYAKVFCRLRDPRDSRKYLCWHRIIDYFHTTEKITEMAEAVFGHTLAASAWARRMRKLLLKRNGVSRALYSAAAMRDIYGLTRGRQKDSDRACRYIQSRSRRMRYAEFQPMRLPIGSRVTGAACKTVFSEHLTLSGMGWKNDRAEVVLSPEPSGGFAQWHLGRGLQCRCGR